jgi:hypothetical protein
MQIYLCLHVHLCMYVCIYIYTRIHYIHMQNHSIYIWILHAAYTHTYIYTYYIYIHMHSLRYANANSMPPRHVVSRPSARRSSIGSGPGRQYSQLRVATSGKQLHTHTHIFVCKNIIHIDIDMFFCLSKRNDDMYECCFSPTNTFNTNIKPRSSKFKRKKQELQYGGNLKIYAFCNTVIL